MKKSLLFSAVHCSSNALLDKILDAMCIPRFQEIVHFQKETFCHHLHFDILNLRDLFLLQNIK